MTGKTEKREEYGDVVARLKAIVESLEGGELSLEASLDRFAEGVKLVKQGERLLSEAEKKIEQLLSDDGRAAPLEVADAPAPAAAKPAAGARKGSAAPADDEDVPF